MGIRSGQRVPVPSAFKGAERYRWVTSFGTDRNGSVPIGTDGSAHTPHRKVESVSADNEQAKGKRGGLRRTSWKPGIPSPNPGGRPRSSYDCAEKIRAADLSQDWITFELEKARDPKLPLSVRTDAWRALIDRGYSKPAADLNVNPGQGEHAVDLSHFTTDEIATWLALHEKAAIASDDTPDGSVNRGSSPQAVASADETPTTTTHRPPAVHDVIATEPAA